jgi:hypothetical protein
MTDCLQEVKITLTVLQLVDAFLVNMVSENGNDNACERDGYASAGRTLRSSIWKSRIPRKSTVMTGRNSWTIQPGCVVAIPLW